MRLGSVFVFTEAKVEEFFIRPGQRVLLAGLPVGTIERVDGSRVYVQWDSTIELGTYQGGGNERPTD